MILRNFERAFIKKIIAFSLALLFSSPHLIWAFEPGTFLDQQSLIYFNGQPVELPAQLGKIEKYYGQHGNRLVIHIQDLHCNYEVQTNISKTLHWLAEKIGLKLVAVEGASLPIDPEQIREFPEHHVRNEVCDYFVRQGRLSGAELYAATGEHPIRLEGAENEELYQANRRTVDYLMQDEGQGYVFDLREILSGILPKIASPRLQQLEARKSQYQDGRGSLRAYCRYLTQAARTHNLTVEIYPAVDAYARSSPSPDISGGMNPDLLFLQVRHLEQALEQTLAVTEEEKEWVSLGRRLDIIEKLLAVSALPSDLAEFRKAPETFEAQPFLDFARRCGQEEWGDLEISGLHDYLAAAQRFYSEADERSQRLAENLVSKMEAGQEQAAVLITGGFHTERILASLQSRGMSVVSVQPRLNQQDLVNPYYSLLKNYRTPLEKMLAQDQKLFMLEPSLPQVRAAGKTQSELVFARQYDLLAKSFYLWRQIWAQIGVFYRWPADPRQQRARRERLAQTFIREFQNYPGAEGVIFHPDTFRLYRTGRHLAASCEVTLPGGETTLAVGWRSQESDLLLAPFFLGPPSIIGGHHLAVVNPRVLQEARVELNHLALDNESGRMPVFWSAAANSLENVRHWISKILAGRRWVWIVAVVVAVAAAGYGLHHWAAVFNFRAADFLTGRLPPELKQWLAAAQPVHWVETSIRNAAQAVVQPLTALGMLVPGWSQPDSGEALDANADSPDQALSSLFTEITRRHSEVSEPFLFTLLLERGMAPEAAQKAIWNYARRAQNNPAGLDLAALADADAETMATLPRRIQECILELHRQAWLNVPEFVRALSRVPFLERTEQTCFIELLKYIQDLGQTPQTPKPGHPALQPLLTNSSQNIFVTQGFEGFYAQRKRWSHLREFYAQRPALGESLLVAHFVVSTHSDEDLWALLKRLDAEGVAPSDIGRIIQFGKPPAEIETLLNHLKANQFNPSVYEKVINSALSTEKKLMAMADTQSPLPKKSQISMQARMNALKDLEKTNHVHALTSKMAELQEAFAARGWIPKTAEVWDLGTSPGLGSENELVLKILSAIHLDREPWLKAALQDPRKRPKISLDRLRERLGLLTGLAADKVPAEIVVVALPVLKSNQDAQELIRAFRQRGADLNMFTDVLSAKRPVLEITALHDALLEAGIAKTNIRAIIRATKYSRHAIMRGLKAVQAMPENQRGTYLLAMLHQQVTWAQVLDMLASRERAGLRLDRLDLTEWLRECLPPRERALITSRLQRLAQRQARFPTMDSPGTSGPERRELLEDLEFHRRLQNVDLNGRLELSEILLAESDPAGFATLQKEWPAAEAEDRVLWNAVRDSYADLTRADLTSKNPEKKKNAVEVWKRVCRLLVSPNAGVRTEVRKQVWQWYYEPQGIWNVPLPTFAYYLDEYSPATAFTNNIRDFTHLSAFLGEWNERRNLGVKHTARALRETGGDPVEWQGSVEKEKRRLTDGGSAVRTHRGPKPGLMQVIELLAETSEPAFSRTSGMDGRLRQGMLAGAYAQLLEQIKAVHAHPAGLPDTPDIQTTGTDAKIKFSESFGRLDLVQQFMLLNAVRDDEITDARLALTKARLVSAKMLTPMQTAVVEALDGAGISAWKLRAQLWEQKGKPAEDLADDLISWLEEAPAAVTPGEISATTTLAKLNREELKRIWKEKGPKDERRSVEAAIFLKPEDGGQTSALPIIQEQPKPGEPREPERTQGAMASTAASLIQPGELAADHPAKKWLDSLKSANLFSEENYRELLLILPPDIHTPHIFWAQALLALNDKYGTPVFDAKRLYYLTRFISAGEIARRADLIIALLKDLRKPLESSLFDDALICPAPETVQAKIAKLETRRELVAALRSPMALYEIQNLRQRMKSLGISNRSQDLVLRKGAAADSLTKALDEFEGFLAENHEAAQAEAKPAGRPWSKGDAEKEFIRLVGRWRESENGAAKIPAESWVLPAEVAAFGQETVRNVPARKSSAEEYAIEGVDLRPLLDSGLITDKEIKRIRKSHRPEQPAHPLILKTLKAQTRLKAYPRFTPEEVELLSRSMTWEEFGAKVPLLAELNKKRLATGKYIDHQTLTAALLSPRAAGEIIPLISELSRRKYSNSIIQGALANPIPAGEIGRRLKSLESFFLAGTFHGSGASAVLSLRTDFFDWLILSLSSLFEREGQLAQQIAKRLMTYDLRFGDILILLDAGPRLENMLVFFGFKTLLNTIQRQAGISWLSWLAGIGDKPPEKVWSALPSGGPSAERLRQLAFVLGKLELVQAILSRRKSAATASAGGRETPADDMSESAEEGKGAGGDVQPGPEDGIKNTAAEPGADKNSASETKEIIRTVTLPSSHEWYMLFPRPSSVFWMRSIFGFLEEMRNYPFLQDLRLPVNVGFDFKPNVYYWIQGPSADGNFLIPSGVPAGGRRQLAPSKAKADSLPGIRSRLELVLHRMPGIGQLREAMENRNLSPPAPLPARVARMAQALNRVAFIKSVDVGQGMTAAIVMFSAAARTPAQTVGWDLLTDKTPAQVLVEAAIEMLSPQPRHYTWPPVLELKRKAEMKNRIDRLTGVRISLPLRPDYPLLAPAGPSKPAAPAAGLIRQLARLNTHDLGYLQRVQNAVNADATEPEWIYRLLSNVRMNDEPWLEDSLCRNLSETLTLERLAEKANLLEQLYRLDAENKIRLQDGEGNDFWFDNFIADELLAAMLSSRKPATWIWKHVAAGDKDVPEHTIAVLNSQRSPAEVDALLKAMLENHLSLDAQIKLLQSAAGSNPSSAEPEQTAPQPRAAEISGMSQDLKRDRQEAGRLVEMLRAERLSEALQTALLLSPWTENDISLVLDIAALIPPQQKERFMAAWSEKRLDIGEALAAADKFTLRRFRLPGSALEERLRVLWRGIDGPDRALWQKHTLELFKHWGTPLKNILQKYPAGKTREYMLVQYETWSRLPPEKILTVARSLLGKALPKGLAAQITNTSPGLIKNQPAGRAPHPEGALGREIRKNFDWVQQILGEAGLLSGRHWPQHENILPPGEAESYVIRALSGIQINSRPWKSETEIREWLDHINPDQLIDALVNQVHLYHQDRMAAEVRAKDRRSEWGGIYPGKMALLDDAIEILAEAGALAVPGVWGRLKLEKSEDAVIAASLLEAIDLRGKPWLSAEEIHLQTKNIKLETLPSLAEKLSRAYRSESRANFPTRDAAPSREKTLEADLKRAMRKLNDHKLLDRTAEKRLLERHAGKVSSPRLMLEDLLLALVQDGKRWLSEDEAEELARRLTLPALAAKAGLIKHMQRQGDEWSTDVLAAALMSPASDAQVLRIILKYQKTETESLLPAMLAGGWTENEIGEWVGLCTGYFSPAAMAEGFRSALAPERVMKLAQSLLPLEAAERHMIFIRILHRELDLETLLGLMESWRIADRPLDLKYFAEMIENGMSREEVRLAKEQLTWGTPALDDVLLPWRAPALEGDLHPTVLRALVDLFLPDENSAARAVVVEKHLRRQAARENIRVNGSRLKQAFQKKWINNLMATWQQAFFDTALNLRRALDLLAHENLLNPFTTCLAIMREYPRPKNYPKKPGTTKEVADEIEHELARTLIANFQIAGEPWVDPARLALAGIRVTLPMLMEKAEFLGRLHRQEAQGRDMLSDRELLAVLASRAPAEEISRILNVWPPGEREMLSERENLLPAALDGGRTAGEITDILNLADQAAMPLESVGRALAGGWTVREIGILFRLTADVALGLKEALADHFLAREGSLTELVFLLSHHEYEYLLDDQEWLDLFRKGIYPASQVAILQFFFKKIDTRVWEALSVVKPDPVRQQKTDAEMQNLDQKIRDRLRRILSRPSIQATRIHDEPAPLFTTAHLMNLLETALKKQGLPQSQTAPEKASGKSRRNIYLLGLLPGLVSGLGLGAAVFLFQGAFVWLAQGFLGLPLIYLAWRGGLLLALRKVAGAPYQKADFIMDVRNLAVLGPLPLPDEWVSWIKGEIPRLPHSLAALEIRTSDTPWWRLFWFGGRAAYFELDRQTGKPVLYFHRHMGSVPSAQRLGMVGHEVFHLLSAEPRLGQPGVASRRRLFWRVWNYLEEEARAWQLECRLLAALLADTGGSRSEVKKAEMTKTGRVERARRRAGAITAKIKSWIGQASQSEERESPGKPDWPQPAHQELTGAKDNASLAGSRWLLTPQWTRRLMTPDWQVRPSLKVLEGLWTALLGAGWLLILSGNKLDTWRITDGETAEWLHRVMSVDALQARKYDFGQVRREAYNLPWLGRLWRGTLWGDFRYENGRLVLMLPQRLLQTDRASPWRQKIENLLVMIAIQKMLTRAERAAGEASLPDLRPPSAAGFAGSALLPILALGSALPVRWKSLWHALWLSRYPAAYLRAAGASLKALERGPAGREARLAFYTFARRPSVSAARIFKRRMDDVMRDVREGEERKRLQDDLGRLRRFCPWLDRRDKNLRRRTRMLPQAA